MKLSRTIHISLRDLGGHFFRSLMTALGVIFGVAAVVAMMAISEGARQEAVAEIKALGTDIIIVESIKPTAGSNVTQESRWGALEYGVTDADFRHIGSVFENIRTLVPVRDARQTIYSQGLRTDIEVLGITPEFQTITHTKLADKRGRLICDLDGQKTQPGCIIGTRAARQLFGFHDPLGKTLIIGGAAFRVVGLFNNPFNLRVGGTRDLNNQILMHIKVVDAFFGEVVRQQGAGAFENTKVAIDYLYVAIQDLTQIENTAARLKTYLASTHPRGDYRVLVPYEQMKLLEATERRAAIVLAAIAGISLLVGGIGIMNIMMATVYERIREIGTRRAMGAKKRDILLQFLIESTLLTTMGGVTGVFLGVGMAKAVTTWWGMSTVVTPLSIVISFAVSVATGVIFGTYPAWKAANIHPIVALRAE